MHLKHPEILWALFLLLIPVFVHLFRLRKFRKEYFTNVRFLQTVIRETRKSSRLKKWLVLCTRLLALAAIIIAFTQPYTANKEIDEKPSETLVYLDNSFSMQLKGPDGELYKRAVNELIGNFDRNTNFTLFTNTNTFGPGTVSSIQNELLSEGYSSIQTPLSEVLLKAQQKLSGEKANLVVISDFQEFPNEDPIIIPENLNTEFITLKPTQVQNISVDSLNFRSENQTELILQIYFSKSGTIADNVPVSVYGDGTLLSRSNLNFESGNSVNNIEISIPYKPGMSGSVEVEDNGLRFDNRLYFNIQNKQPVKVRIIGNADDRFLQRIFKENDFIVSSESPERTDYNTLGVQNFIILNEPGDIPVTLISALQEAVSKGSKLLVIPDSNWILADYNSIALPFNFPEASSISDQEGLITTINFEHPLFKGVFERAVENFEYPRTKKFFKTGSGGEGIIRFAGNDLFLAGNKGNYFFTAAIDTDNSNFQNSPLIVPVIYNMAIQSLRPSRPYYTIGQENIFDLAISIGQDEIIEISGNNEHFIPLQQRFNDRVTLMTTDMPETAGHYDLMQKSSEIGAVSYNYSRKESNLFYRDLSQIEGVQISDQVKAALLELKSKNMVNELWKWFVIFALACLFAEMLILKYVK
ncbi:vWA domain-containing protein [Robertkochia solimangrovi]|uniref:vWA domain-containing protein n=1 Tax=Robertkochia solimangrovi TaxID=2213046 RepID=UPI001180B21F|nr:VWA domain-containing protein [Robertkochia solimangrovi]TRZ45335.1 hypothetical protein DMZ48_06215 [Robertkochia solimangrovi]